MRTVELRPVEHSSVLAIDISDSTGDLTALFYGRSNIPGVCAEPGSGSAGGSGSGRTDPS